MGCRERPRGALNIAGTRPAGVMTAGTAPVSYTHLGGFCGAKVLEILARELGIPEEEVTKFGGKSNILYEKTK